MVPTTRKANEATVDLWRGFRPTHSQERFMRSQAFIRLFGSGFGSGKSSMGCRESIKWAATYPGSRNMIGRLLATDLSRTTMVTFWKEMEKVGFREGQHYTFNRSTKEIAWWNGATTLFVHLDNPEELGSLELTSAFIDEGSEVSDDVYVTLVSSRMRWHITGCDHQKRVEKAIEEGRSAEWIEENIPDHCPHGIWICTNPGGSQFLREVIRGKVEGSDFIKAQPKDNPYNPPGYYRKIEEIGRIKGPAWIKRFLDGDWDSFAGQRFTMFDRASHVLPSPFRPDHRYEVVEGWDFGHRETFVVWIAYEPRQEEPVVMFHELQVKEVDAPEDVANQVKRIRAEYGITERVRALGDPAGAAASQFSSIGPIMAYANLGISIAPCRHGKDPKARADLMAHMFNIRRRQPDGSWWPGLVIGPNCPALIDSVMNLRWDEKSIREQFVKENDHGCVIEGSLVSTPTGPRTIENLAPGDEVLTRQGPRRVQVVARTQERADCLTITTSGGRTLDLTADHPVWVVGRGWVRSDALGYGDIIHAWSNPETSSNTAGTDTVDTPTPNSGAIGSTTAAEAGRDTSTAPSGRTPTGARSPRGMRSTTMTGTPSTTTRPIWSSSPLPSTGTSTRSQKSGWATSAPTSTASDTSRPIGTDPMKAASGTAGTARPRGTGASPGPTPAPTAAGSSSLSTSARVSATAPSGARRPRDVPAASTTRTAPASGAEAPSPSTVTSGPGRALDSVVAVCAGPRGVPVWNLTVHEVHEYYANGILVSNCDAAGYGLIGVPPPSDAPSTALRPGVNRSVRPDDILRPDDGDGWVDAA